MFVYIFYDRLFVMVLVAIFVNSADTQKKIEDAGYKPELGIFDQ